LSDPRLLTGREPARGLRDELRTAIAGLPESLRPPGLAIVRVGSDEAAAGYARQIIRTCKRVGVEGRELELSAGLDTHGLADRVAELGRDPQIQGIIVQFPLPGGVDAQAVAEAVPPEKDVDRVTSAAMGELFTGVETLAPATAAAVAHLLDFYAIELEGRRAVVIGRSNIVGKPVAMLLLARHATVTLCHSRTVDLAGVAATADVLIVAVGRRQMVDERYVRPGAVVIDVGTNYADGAVAGDVDFASAARKASAITPVPGGVGPLTNYLLMKNLVTLIQRGARQL
jgi:methylenetetrahydrofolate dehydrogenase (NADP+)/methenyltetrahydrofolate cyclohydrolase